MALLDEELEIRDSAGREILLVAGWGQFKGGGQSLALCLFHGVGEAERLLYDWTPDEAAALEGDSMRLLSLEDYQGGALVFEHEALVAIAAYARRVVTLLEAGGTVGAEPRSRLSSLAG